MRKHYRQYGLQQKLIAQRTKICVWCYLPSSVSGFYTFLHTYHTKHQLKDLGLGHQNYLNMTGKANYLLCIHIPTLKQISDCKRLFLIPGLAQIARTGVQIDCNK